MRDLRSPSASTMPETIAIIPARGGSKGVPGKNKRLVAGRPLIAYSIAAAHAANAVDRVVVSTDDPEIASIAREEGAELVERPAGYSKDDSPVIDAVIHALNSLGIVAPGAIVLLQPTSPLRTSEDIDRSVSLFKAHQTPVCSVYRAEDAHPARMYWIKNERLHALMPELAALRRQDLPPVFHRNGAIYVFGPAQLEQREIITDDMIAYEMPTASSINIDTELDLMLLEAVLAHRQ